MLDRELAPALAPLPAPASFAALRQESRLEEARRFVVGIAEAVVKSIRPAALPGLADAAQVFFEQMRELGGAFRLEPAAAHALGQGGDLSPALRFLMASYLATQEFAQAPSGARDESLPVTGDLRAVMRQAALRAAADSGLKGAEAQRFAEAYADLVTASGAALPEWPADEREDVS